MLFDFDPKIRGVSPLLDHHSLNESYLVTDVKLITGSVSYNAGVGRRYKWILGPSPMSSQYPDPITTYKSQGRPNRQRLW